MERSILFALALLSTCYCGSISAAAQTENPDMTIYDRSTGIPDEVMFTVFLGATVGHPAEDADDHKHRIREIARRMELVSFAEAETVLRIFEGMHEEWLAEKAAFMRREICPFDTPRPTGKAVLDRLAAYDALNDVVGARFLARLQSQLAERQYEALLDWMADLKQGTKIGRTNWHFVYADRDADMKRQEICSRLDSRPRTAEIE